MEVYVHAEKIVSLLRLDFSFPAPAHSSCKDPETLLLASIVLAVKFLYPFDDRSSAEGLILDWTRWSDKFKSGKPQRHNRERFETITSADVYDLTPDDMDSYLDWYQETELASQQGMSQIADSYDRQQN